MQRVLSIARVKQNGHSEKNLKQGNANKVATSDQASTSPASGEPISPPSIVAAWGPDDASDSPAAPPPSPSTRGASFSPSRVRSTFFGRSELKIDAQLEAERVSPIPSPNTSPTSARRHTGGLTNRLKQLVSKEKRRFSSDGFDLDLTYVTQRLIALGYPAEKIEGIYRNHYRDVFRFFEQRHPSRYRVYNLCVERRYAPDEKFHGRVAEFSFEDHCPPPLSLILPFCQDVHAWLNENPENIVAVHCKAGKGRTGVMLCTYMLYSRMWRTAHGALEYFAAARSMKLQGVTILSQRRFVGYFGEMCRRSESTEDLEVLGSYEDEANREKAMTLTEYHTQWLQETHMMPETGSPRGSGSNVRPHAKPVLPTRVNLVLVAVVLNGVAGHKKTNSSAIEWRVRVECGAIRPRAAVYDLPGNFQRQLRSRTESGNTEDGTQLEMTCNRELVWDEVKVELRRRNGSVLGHFWFHTAFINQVEDHFELALAKSEIDKIAKDIKHGHKKFAPEFRVRLRFELATDEDMAKSATDVTA
ncbi:Phosphatidylinositol-3,4,5-trisphosphate 3-phosphatase [Phytophthora megakarya]|uniref:Phosphatidylinositol-3,4,5-trisphosphate 3-phosphatase n=1 Tax=Phytophthora megakarya TaxID=4795 RepID=A0A225WWA6_9STRA|nr:Phosphatidylinositol-3,4,5-trisphosphate 3-phosphatase [Phytophthora megakarya]